jgi:hypothetical protein
MRIDRGHSSADFTARAGAVVDEWHRGGMAYTYRLGFVPTDNLTRLTAESLDKSGTYILGDTFPSEAQFQAFVAGRFALSGTLAAAVPPSGQITFEGAGGTTSVPLATAQAAFAAMQRSDAKAGCDCITLNVTGATLGTVRMPSSRGAATVPAWIFAVEGLRAPVARVAVASSASWTDVLRLPAELLPESPLWADRVESYTGEAQELTLHFTGGACDLSHMGEVYETADAVVVGVAITAKGGTCIAIGIPGTVDIQLKQPVGSRVVLAVSAGQLVPKLR